MIIIHAAAAATRLRSTAGAVWPVAEKSKPQTELSLNRKNATRLDFFVNYSVKRQSFCDFQLRCSHCSFKHSNWWRHKLYRRYL